MNVFIHMIRNSYSVKIYALFMVQICLLIISCYHQLLIANMIISY